MAGATSIDVGGMPLMQAYDEEDPPTSIPYNRSGTQMFEEPSTGSAKSTGTRRKEKELGFTTLLGSELLQANLQTPVNTVTALRDKKIIMLYFSASWSRPCELFTPELRTKYEANAAREGIEVVFVSSCKDNQSFSDYCRKMPWLAVPYESEDTRKKIQLAFKVKGVPTLVVLSANGDPITSDGVTQVNYFFNTSDPCCCNIL